MNIKDWWDLKIEKPLPVVKKKKPAKVIAEKAVRPIVKERVVKEKKPRVNKEDNSYRQFNIRKKK
jgi:hypothetical protein